MRPPLKSVFSAWIAALSIATFPALAGAPPGQAAPASAGHANSGATVSAGLAARLRYWHEMALRADALDHTPPSGSRRTWREQFGPVRSSRAMAIAHLAMVDACSAILHDYPSYSGMAAAPSDSSLDAALARAMRDTLAALYPAQAVLMDQAYASDMQRIPDGRAKYNGAETGRRAAAAILAMLAGGYPAFNEPVIGVDFFPSNAPGKWRMDPVSRSPYAVGAYAGSLRPFVIPSTAPFRPPLPPALGSSAYAAAFAEVKRLGGNGVSTPTRRTPGQTVAGIYWAYDGAPFLGTPARLFNQVAMRIATQRALSPLETARMLALVNVAMADTALVLWKAKYEVQFWRPVTGIREADEGTGPSGLGDGNPDTRGDPGWTPLGAPASNATSPDFTPPFPAYPSGHAGLGSALFQALRRFYGTDAVAFTFISDEYNGVTRDNDGTVRPRLPRSFSSPRPRKNADKAGSILACTGLSTRPVANTADGAWPTMCSSTAWRRMPHKKQHNAIRAQINCYDIAIRVNLVSAGSPHQEVSWPAKPSRSAAATTLPNRSSR